MQSSWTRPKCANKDAILYFGFEKPLTVPQSRVTDGGGRQAVHRQKHSTKPASRLRTITWSNISHKASLFSAEVLKATEKQFALLIKSTRTVAEPHRHKSATTFPTAKGNEGGLHDDDTFKSSFHIWDDLRSLR